MATQQPEPITATEHRHRLDFEGASQLVFELRRRLDNGKAVTRLLFQAGADFVRTRGGTR